MAALILTRSDVAALLSDDDCIAAAEEAFRQHAEGVAVPPSVFGVHVPGGGFHVKTAGIRTPRAIFAAKINGNFPENAVRSALPTIQGVIYLADLATGEPLAVVDSAEITIRRTAAATAVAAKHLAREDATTVAIVGCGAQARAQLRSLAVVRPIAEVRAFDIDADKAHRFANEVRSTSPVAAHASRTAREAVANADLVVTCTTSRSAIVHAGDVAPGAFVAAVGADNPEKQEIDARLLAKATIVVDVIDQAAAFGDLHHAIAAGLLGRDAVYAELGEIVCGRRPGRRSADEVIVFDSTGMALQDANTTAVVYERALAAGVGHRCSFTA